jgi:hypothetical protein
VSERTQQPVASVEGAQPDERVPARVVLDLDRFKLLLDGLLARQPEDRARVAGEIIDLLIAMRAPGHDVAESAVILKQLDLKSLSGVIDAEGRNARKEAVETLMAMGFPHALKISPEDFEWARGDALGDWRWRSIKRAALAMAALFGGVALTLVAISTNLQKELAGVAFGGGVLAFIILIVTQREQKKP